VGGNWVGGELYELRGSSIGDLDWGDGSGGDLDWGGGIGGLDW
jgi:hypothetical protein